MYFINIYKEYTFQLLPLPNVFPSKMGSSVLQIEICLIKLMKLILYFVALQCNTSITCMFISYKLSQVSLEMVCLCFGFF